MKVIAIKKSGNSTAVRIPSEIIKSLSLKVDDSVTVEIVNGSIVLTPIESNYKSEKQTPKKSDSLAEAARLHMGLTQRAMAEYFGITLSGWQKKEMGISKLSVAEQFLFKMIIGTHPEYIMIRKANGLNQSINMMISSTTSLANYLSGKLVLPSKLDELINDLNNKTAIFKKEWNADFNSVLDNANNKNKK